MLLIVSAARHFPSGETNSPGRLITSFRPMSGLDWAAATEHAPTKIAKANIPAGGPPLADDSFATPTRG